MHHATDSLPGCDGLLRQLLIGFENYFLYVDSCDIVFIFGRELIMGFQDVVFLPSRDSFSIIFLENCCRGESLVTTTCLNTVVGVSKSMLPVKYTPLKPLFVSVEFHRDHKTHKVKVNHATLSFMDTTRSKTVVWLSV